MLAGTKKRFIVSEKGQNITGGWLGRCKHPSSDMSTDEEEHVTGRSSRSVRTFMKARLRSRLGGKGRIMISLAVSISQQTCISTSKTCKDQYDVRAKAFFSKI